MKPDIKISIGERIEQIIRKSVIGRNLSRMRKSSPFLYASLRNVYSKLFRIRSQHGLARYQVRSMNRFLNWVPADILRQSVLEIGSDLDAKVIRELRAKGCSNLVGVNPAFTDEELLQIAPSLPEGCVLARSDMRSTGLADASFGTIFSVSVFEHLLEFDRCLMEMHRILVPGGIVYADFGPIWSSSLGHHVFANVDGVQARHWDPKLNPLENFSHLLGSPDEMRASLTGRVSDSMCEAIVEWVYTGNDINRLFFEDYIRLIEASPFELVHMDVDREYVPEQVLSDLRVRYPGYVQFDVRNVELVLKKREINRV